MTLASELVAQIGAEIAYRIRAELVCCHVFDDMAKWREDDSPYDAQEFTEALAAFGHDLCYWGEAAARLAETHHLESVDRTR